ncbi:hypothetical protein INH39_10100 [Massilia violaceinigra]|uniref:Uncharacterized protein n=1 Tax=Massilia violaceinigra TaxID=2045208 RepID=A0ABY4AAZ5_9BURK|nr:hypothetical protein [Massilia violaceinigra]UOD31984.1 hypothetical protein INH39_10100 [Massilia violaceinigra]
MRRMICATMLPAVMTMLGACGGGDSPAAAAQAAPPVAAVAASGPARAMPAPPALRAAPALALAPPEAPLPNDVMQLRQEVAGLRREVAELRLMLTRAPPAPQPAAPLATPVTPETPGVAPAETMFRAEQVDHAWSSQASAAVRAALARANAGLEPQVRVLECRTRTCRVEVNPASADLLESALPAVLANLGSTLPNMTATQVGSGDGSEATVLYLTR